MWGRKRTTETAKADEQRLREALRQARIESAERTGVVVDLHDAEIARLDLLNEALNPVFAEIPASVEMFDRGISRGDPPRLWIDMIAHVVMARDKRVYRFLQDSRYGPKVMAESAAIEEMVDAITKYVARRLIERERALAAEGDRQPVAPRGGFWRALAILILGIALGVAGVFIAAWIAAGGP